MKTLSKVLVLIPLLLAIAQVAHAQPPPGDTPLDPISWTVLGVGGAIAGKKYYKKKFGKKE